MVTWRQLIEDELEDFPGEQIIAAAPGQSALDVQFDNSYGLTEGSPFTAWTQTRVLFPVVYYDGAESVGSVPRDPNNVATQHVGG